MQRDERPSSYTAVAGGCSRFPSSSYRENGTFLHSVRRPPGSSRDHSAASCLGNSGIAIVVVGHCRRVVPMPPGRCYLFSFWSSTMVRASTLVSLMAARTRCVFTGKRLLQSVRTRSSEIGGAAASSGPCRTGTMSRLCPVNGMK